MTEFHEKINAALTVLDETRQDIPSIDDEENRIHPDHADPIFQRKFGFKLSELMDFSESWVPHYLMQEMRNGANPMELLRMVFVFAFSAGAIWQKDNGERV